MENPMENCLPCSSSVPALSAGIDFGIFYILGMIFCSIFLRTFPGKVCFKYKIIFSTLVAFRIVGSVRQYGPIVLLRAFKFSKLYRLNISLSFGGFHTQSQ